LTMAAASRRNARWTEMVPTASVMAAVLQQAAKTCRRVNMVQGAGHTISIETEAGTGIEMAVISIETEAGTGIEMEVISIEIEAGTGIEMEVISIEIEAGKGIEMEVISIEIEAGKGIEMAVISIEIEAGKGIEMAVISIEIEAGKGSEMVVIRIEIEAGKGIEMEVKMAMMEVPSEEMKRKAAKGRKIGRRIASAATAIATGAETATNVRCEWRAISSGVIASTQDAGRRTSTATDDFTCKTVVKSVAEGKIDGYCESRRDCGARRRPTAPPHQQTLFVSSTRAPLPES
jgi:hypothetical protein